ncbi:putative bir1 protein [Plasmodium yoelii yoelii]|uniref:Bir1 protein n=1 Tax=Plasmodium yoelii yoelii TaxID=73239 RepID=Q7R8Q2_PLAYO|nr:putative bir1 protein [Plasmodium yoelii yoelii]
MYINNVCSGFDILWKYFPDESNNSGNSGFRELIFKEYCNVNSCDSDINKINAGCLWLFNYFFVTSAIPFYRDFYKHVVVCIMIWLSYKLNQKTENGTRKLNDFYLNNIANETEYTEHKIYGKTFKSYKEIIDQINEYMDIDINKISKFYELLKLLCNMITDNKDKNSSSFSEHANKFVVEYEQLLNDDNNIDDSSYDKILRLLSNYYNTFEKHIVFPNIEMNRGPLPTKKIAENDGVEDSNEIKIDEPSSETGNQDIETIALSPNTALSGSSLVNKIIPVLSIFGAIAIFLGISYKVNNEEFKNYFHLYMKLFVIWISETSSKTTIKRKAKKIKKKLVINISFEE